MHLPTSNQPIHAESFFDRNGLQPVPFHHGFAPVTCFKCGYINAADNNFCTNCGFPAQAAGDQLALYNFRQFKRKHLKEECIQIVRQARATLYVMSVISVLGAFVLTITMPQNNLRQTVLLVVAAIYLALARWTLTKPFTALLISFLMLISFMAINTWAEFGRMFTTATGVYLLFVQLFLFYFLYRGVKAAYQAEILDEEDKI